MSIIFSEKTLTALYNAGWRPNREIDISHELTILKSENYVVFPSVLDFLKQFGRLEIKFQNSTTPAKDSTIFFTIERALTVFRRQTIELYRADLNVDLCPIGLDSDGIFLAMCANGEVIGIYSQIIYLIGKSGEEAIENYSTWSPSNPFPVIRNYSK